MYKMAKLAPFDPYDEDREIITVEKSCFWFSDSFPGEKFRQQDCVRSRIHNLRWVQFGLQKINGVTVRRKQKCTHLGPPVVFVFARYVVGSARLTPR